MNTRAFSAGIISTLNQEAFIREAVESLADQVDELIVVNDGSTDTTAEILAGLTIPHLRVITHTFPQGVSRSYNEAAQLATAQFLVIQGGDDVSLPGRVLEQTSLLQQSEADMTYCLPIVINSQGKVLPDEAAGEFFYAGTVERAFRHLYFVGNFICAPSVVIRRETYIRWGGFSPSSLYLQDFDLWCALAAEGTIIQSSTRSVKYRKHSTNLSRETNSTLSPKDFRFDAEMDYVLSKALARASEVTLKNLAIEIGFSETKLEKLEKCDFMALIQISHPRKSQVRRGLSYLLSLMESEAGTEKLAIMNMGDEEISTIAMKADHEGRNHTAIFGPKLNNLLSGTN